MAEIMVRQLEDRVVDVLAARARHRGVSLEEEARAILRDAADEDRRDLIREAEAIRARTTLSSPELDSARIIREERDAWG